MMLFENVVTRVRVGHAARFTRRMTSIRTGIELARGVHEGRYDRFGTALAELRG